MQRLDLAVEAAPGPVGDCQTLMKFDMLQALTAIRTAWGLVTQQTVANCFRHAGFVKPSEDKEDEDDMEGAEQSASQESTTPVPVVEESNPSSSLSRLRSLGVEVDGTAKDFINVDSELETSGMPSIEDLVAQAKPSTSKNDSDSDDEADAPPQKVPSLAEAKAAIDVLQRYIFSKVVSDADIESIFVVDRVVDKASVSAAKQTTLDRFFKK